jgi:hypothetical protein
MRNSASQCWENDSASPVLPGPVRILLVCCGLPYRKFWMEETTIFEGHTDPIGSTLTPGFLTFPP